jgi:hypothetical protein
MFNFLENIIVLFFKYVLNLVVLFILFQLILIIFDINFVSFFEESTVLVGHLYWERGQKIQLKILKIDIYLTQKIISNISSKITQERMKGKATCEELIKRYEVEIKSYTFYLNSLFEQGKVRFGKFDELTKDEKAFIDLDFKKDK